MASPAQHALYSPILCISYKRLYLPLEIVSYDQKSSSVRYYQFIAYVLIHDKDFSSLCTCKGPAIQHRGCQYIQSRYEGAQFSQVMHQIPLYLATAGPQLLRKVLRIVYLIASQ